MRLPYSDACVGAGGGGSGMDVQARKVSACVLLLVWLVEICCSVLNFPTPWRGRCCYVHYHIFLGELSCVKVHCRKMSVDFSPCFFFFLLVF